RGANALLMQPPTGISAYLSQLPVQSAEPSGYQSLVIHDIDFKVSGDNIADNQVIASVLG
ncbi:hypothetical protein ACJMK2_037137, partial [Sinanodonta woodiana]